MVLVELKKKKIEKKKDIKEKSVLFPDVFVLKKRGNQRNMWHTRVVYLRRFAILCLLIAAAPDLTAGLRDVSVTVPTAVRRGDNALLICNYDMEGDTLYSVKWYKGRREFYRYTPKENPAMKTFQAPGINVERSLSNQSHVVLSSVQLTNSGKFSCEVSADAPSFHTVIVSGELEVVEIPEQRPTITGIHSRYRLGDIINGNCSSMYSKPAANLTWTINDVPAPPSHLKVYDIIKNPDDNLESSVVEINFMVTHQHFVRGRLKLKCLARIHEIYEQDVEKLIEEDRPRILASGRSPDANLFPFDQQADGELTDQNELYLTHYRDMASSGSSSSITCVSRTRTTRAVTASGMIAAAVSTFDVIFYATIILSIVLSSDLSSLMRALSSTPPDCTNCSTGNSNKLESKDATAKITANIPAAKNDDNNKDDATAAKDKSHLHCYTPQPAPRKQNFPKLQPLRILSTGSSHSATNKLKLSNS